MTHSKKTADNPSLPAETVQSPFHFAIEQAPDMVFWLERNGNFSYVNQQACLALGYQTAELMQLSLWDIDPIFPKERWAEEWRKSQQGQIDTYTSETLHRRKDGSLFPVEVAAKHYWLDGREFHVAFVRDISARKQVEQVLKLTQATIDQASIACFWVTKESQLFYANEQACKSLGYSQDELLKMSVKDIDPDFPSDVWPKFWQELSEKKAFRFETTHQRKDGSCFPVEITSNYIKTGEKEYSCTFVRDITGRKRAEEAIERFRFSIDQASEAVFWVEIDGSFSYVNQQACSALGYSQEELLNLGLWAIDPQFQADHWAAGWTDQENQEKQTYETSHLRKDGSSFPVEVSISRITFGDKEFHIAFVRDITERKQAEKELKQAYADLKATQSQMLQQEKMASIGQLAAGVAHEINNPMGFIASNFKTLGKYHQKLTEYLQAQHQAIEALAPATPNEELRKLRKQLKIDYILEDIQELVEESLDGADRVKAIVQNLKSFSRLDEAEMKETDINECLDTTIKIAWNELKYKATVVKDFGELPTIDSYPQQLNQVFLNLLVNAAQAIEIQGQVTVRTWNGQDSVWIAISDTGKGIPEDLQHRIFEPFFTTKQVGKGTGLGLSISFDIVKKHGGEISVESADGRGATFTICLPCKPRRAAPREDNAAADQS